MLHEVEVRATFYISCEVFGKACFPEMMCEKPCTTYSTSHKSTHIQY